MEDNNDSLFVIIVGCGSVGAYCASCLSRVTSNILVIDKDSEAFSGLSEDFLGRTMTGDALQEEVLITAKAYDAAVVIVLTGDQDLNTLLAVAAKKVYNVPKVITLAAEPKFQNLFSEIGINSLSYAVVDDKYLMAREVLKVIKE